MTYAIFRLTGGDRIAICLDSITTICEIKPKSPKKSPCGANIRVINDEKGWDVEQTFDEVIDMLQGADTPDETEKADHAKE